MGDLSELRNKAAASALPESGETVDSTENKEYISDSEQSGDVLSNPDPNAISDEMRKQLGVPDNVKTLDDVKKHFSEINKMRGAQQNEVGELRKSHEQLQREIAVARQQYEMLSRQMQPQQPQQTEQDIEAELNRQLAENPIEGLRSVAKRELNPALEPIQRQLSELSEYIQDRKIADARMSFVEQNKLTKDDTDAMAEVIAEDPDFFRPFKTNEQRMKAALLMVKDRRGSEAAVAQTETEIATKTKIEADKKQAQVLSPSNQRPASAKKSPEQMKAELVARMSAEGRNF